jgi:3-hydroxyacyl-[acyl-carrier-protein] dehydratase
MPAPPLHLDPTGIDCSRPVADIRAIREVLPHRHEFEMLTAVVSIDPVGHVVVGYKDLGPDEFWARGHFPGNPVLPGVLMCEAAAQLCAFYTLQTVNKGMFMGLGGIENTRFRRAVRPGDRLVLVGKGSRVRPKMTVFNVQGFVGPEMAFHTDVIGVPLGRAGDGDGA